MENLVVEPRFGGFKGADRLGKSLGLDGGQRGVALTLNQHGQESDPGLIHGTLTPMRAARTTAATIPIAIRDCFIVCFLSRETADGSIPGSRDGGIATIGVPFGPVSLWGTGGERVAASLVRSMPLTPSTEALSPQKKPFPPLRR